MRTGPGARRNPGGLAGILVASLALVGCRGETPVFLDELPLQALQPEQRIGRFLPTRGVIRWVGLGPDSTVALGQAGDHLIRIFDSAGVTVASVGGPESGNWSGPSAAPRQGGAGWLGDTLWVQDGSLGRIILYRPIGEPARSLPPLAGALPEPSERGADPSFLRVWPLVLFPGDTLLVLADQPVGRPGMSAESRRLLRIRPDGRILRNVAAVPPEPLRDTASSPYLVSARPSAYHVAPGGDRIGLVEAIGEEGSGAWRLLVLSAHGETLLDRRYRFMDSERPRGLLLGGDQRIWLTVPEGPEGTRWLVLGSDGEPQARLEPPTLARILHADNTHLWVSEPSPDGALAVVRYRIREEEVPPADQIPGP